MDNWLDGWKNFRSFSLPASIGQERDTTMLMRYLESHTVSVEDHRMPARTL